MRRATPFPLRRWAGNHSRPALKVVGYAADFKAAGGAGFKLFHTREELTNHLALVRVRTEDEQLSSFWDQIGDFFGDVWEGIKNGLIAISDVVVDVANKVADFTVQIGEKIVQGV